MLISIKEFYPLGLILEVCNATYQGPFAMWIKTAQNLQPDFGSTLSNEDIHVISPHPTLKKKQH